RACRPGAIDQCEADWETRVLARLEEFRRYPSRARAARQQGTVFVRFALNRAGQVLSAEIARSSGFYPLDQAALATLRPVGRLPSASARACYLAPGRGSLLHSPGNPRPVRPDGAGRVLHPMTQDLLQRPARSGNAVLSSFRQTTFLVLLQLC